VINALKQYVLKPVHAAPLAVFRIIFGLLMLASVIRFMAKGWVYSMYVKPQLFFPYYGFEWIKPFGETAMYAVFILMAIAALCIAAGFLYRISAIVFFVLFTYVELIDKTNYLNHYYFVSIISFLLIFLPAQRYFSLDAFFKPSLKATHIPNYFLLVIKVQVFMVYFFAGLAKLNPDWLLHAQPLKIWLPAHSEMPLIGTLLTKEWVAYAFSWFGCLYDLIIPFLLFMPRFIKPAYALVILFHLATSLFFNIGMFPYIMIALTGIFFSEPFHIRLIQKLKALTGRIALEEPVLAYTPSANLKKTVLSIMILHLVFQLCMPFRFLLYPGNLYWTEQGYRFSWRVMLMEKAGTAFFYVRDKSTGKETEISNGDYLTPMQEKMMSTQPDMMIRYAQFLKAHYEQLGIRNTEIVAEAYVTLNGRPSRLMVDKNTDLSTQTDTYEQKNWILPYTDH
jgi:hypothetical protein